MSLPPDYSTLGALLHRRLAVIADHELRERDAAAQLMQLRAVSEAIEQEHARLRPLMPARLRHYMEQASYAKALECIQEMQQKRQSSETAHL